MPLHSTRPISITAQLSTLKLRPAALPLCVIGGYWLLLIYNLGAQWSVYEQYGYGWSVPFLCVWLLWKRLQDRQSQVHSPQSTVLSPESKVQSLESEAGSRVEGRGGATVHASRITHHDSRFSHLPSSIFYLLLFLLAL